MAGFGCTIPREWDHKCHLPSVIYQHTHHKPITGLNFQQSFASLKQGVVRKLAIATESQYVYDGIPGSAYKLRSSGWVNKQGPVAHVDLWIRVLQLMDESSLMLSWIKVPRHTVAVIEGNRRADLLVDKGRLSSPLYQVLPVPERLVFSIELPCTPHRIVHRHCQGQWMFVILKPHLGRRPPWSPEIMHM